MRTYLQLVQRLHQECAVPGLAPTTLVGLTPGSEAQRLADWVADAWIEILELHPDWKFRRRSTSFPTIDGQGTYTQAECGLTDGTLGRWMLDSFRAYHTATGFSGEYYLTEIDYDDWRDTYLIGPNRTTLSAPMEVGLYPQVDGLVIGPIPSGSYTILGDYYLAPTRLSADTDVTGLPAQHDDLGIVWKAMIDYAGYEADSPAFQRATAAYARFINKLEREQLPRIEVSAGW